MNTQRIHHSFNLLENNSFMSSSFIYGSKNHPASEKIEIGLIDPDGVYGLSPSQP